MAENDFSIKACREAIEFEVKYLKGNPLEMLGRYHLRAKHDVFFNKNMITAMYGYLEDHNIRWDQKM